MFSYFVYCMSNGGELTFRTFCESTLQSAIATATGVAGETHSQLLTVEEFEIPDLQLVEPALVPAKNINGEVSYSARDHLMKGGALSTIYRGQEYLISGEIFEQSYFINEEGVRLESAPDDSADELDYREIVGACTISRVGTELEQKFLLEEFDYSHAIDHVLAQLFVMVARSTHVEASLIA